MSEPVIEAEWNNAVEWRCPECGHCGTLRYNRATEAAPEITDAEVDAALREINKFYPTSKFALPPSTVMRRVLEAARAALAAAPKGVTNNRTVA